MNRKISVKGVLFLTSIRPIVKLFGWVSFISAIVFVIWNSYSFLTGVLLVIGVQLGYGLAYVLLIFPLLSLLEKKWEREENI